jgi:hypothetical protein
MAATARSLVPLAREALQAATDRRPGSILLLVPRGLGGRRVGVSDGAAQMQAESVAFNPIHPL